MLETLVMQSVGVAYIAYMYAYELTNYYC